MMHNVFADQAARARVTAPGEAALIRGLVLKIGPDGQL